MGTAAIVRSGIARGTTFVVRAQGSWSRAMGLPQYGAVHGLRFLLPLLLAGALALVVLALPPAGHPDSCRLMIEVFGLLLVALAMAQLDA